MEGTHKISGIVFDLKQVASLNKTDFKKKFEHLADKKKADAGEWYEELQGAIKEAKAKAKEAEKAAPASDDSEDSAADEGGEG